MAQAVADSLLELHCILDIAHMSEQIRAIPF